MTPLFDVTNKNVIITGGAMGIGFGIAKRFVEAGANVLLADLDASKAEQAARQLTTLNQGKAVAFAVDIAAPDAGLKTVDACVRAFGSIDVLINNAGIYPQVPLMQMSADQFDRVLAVNLRGLVMMSKAVGARFIEQKKGGRIINIGSVDSLHPSMVGLAAYDASKGAVLMFTRSFALEMATHGVQVNVILPGGVATEGTNRPLAPGVSAEQARAQMEMFIKMKIPLGRMGQPDEIAGAAIYFASAASSYVTGSSLIIDGGLLLT
ncbi:MAG: SDR family oxidoreductase [Archangium sp.]